MEFASLIAEFGARYGMGELVPDGNGAVGFEVDGRSALFQLLPESETVVAMVSLAACADAGAETVNQLLLKANQALYMQDGMVLVLHPALNRYCLLLRIDIASLDFVGFDKAVAQLLSRAEQWSSFFEKFLPLAAGAEEGGEEDDLSAPPDLFSPDDMLRV